MAQIYILLIFIISIHASDQIFVLFRLSFNFCYFLTPYIGYLNKFASSAYKQMSEPLVQLSTMSFMKITNSISPKWIFVESHC